MAFADAVPIQDAVEVIARIPGDAPDGRWQYVEAVTADGRLVVDLTDPALGEQLTNNELRLGTPKSIEDAEVVSVSPPGGPYQSYGVDSSRRHLVWMTSTSTRLESWPWQLHSYDLKAHAETVLARSPKVGRTDPQQAPGSTDPTLGGGRVFWAEVHGTRKHMTVDVMGCRIARCRPRVIAREAGLPVATDDALYFVDGPGFDRTDRPLQVQRFDLATNRVTTFASLGRGQEAIPGGLAASNRVVAWTHRDGRRQAITIHDVRTSDEIVVTSRAGGIFGYPVATDRFVAWAEASGNSPDQLGGYLYDLRDGTLYELGNRSGFYAITGEGDYVTWQEVAEGAQRADTVVARLR